MLLLPVHPHIHQSIDLREGVAAAASLSLFLENPERGWGKLQQLERERKEELQ